MSVFQKDDTGCVSQWMEVPRDNVVFTAIRTRRRSLRSCPNLLAPCAAIDALSFYHAPPSAL